MRITCVSNSLAGGGAERNALWLAGALGDRGYVITLLTVRNDVPDFYPVPSNVSRARAPVAAARSCRWFGWCCVRQRTQVLKAALLATQAHVVISFIDTINVSVLMALSGTTIPVVVSERTDPRFHDVGHRWTLLRRVYYPRAAKVVVQTQAVKHWAEGIWPRWTVVAIPNPVLPATAPICQDKPTSLGRKNIVAMGRLAREKGFDLLFDAFTPLAAQFADWDLVIFGQGPLETELKVQAETLGISQRVHFRGAIMNPWQFAKHIDMFVLSSRYEGFPNALCEAMAHNIPVVSFDCPSGPAEIIEHETNGLLVPPGDVEGLRRSMRRLMESKEYRDSIALRASKIIGRFSEDEILRHWELLISGTVKGHRDR